MNSIIIITCKIIGKLISSDKKKIYPAILALKLNNHILDYFKMPKLLIYIVESRNKNDNQNILAQIYKGTGYKVCYNSFNSKLEIITYLINISSIFGKIKTDALILIIDEKIIKSLTSELKPNFIIINNQDDKYNYYLDDFINVNNKTNVILNSNNRIINKLYSEYENNIITFEIIQNNKTRRHSFNNKHFKITINKDNSFNINNIRIKTYDSSYSNISRLTTSYITALKSGIPKTIICEVLNDLSIKNKYLDEIKINNINYTLLFNDNIVTYNNCLKYINKQLGNKTIIINGNKIDRTSLIWDVNYELLEDRSINNIIYIGDFISDIRVRLKYAGIDINKIATCSSLEMLQKSLEQYKDDKIYFLVSKDNKNLIRNLVRQEI